jgi:hypothetical protein
MEWKTLTGVTPALNQATTQHQLDRDADNQASPEDHSNSFWALNRQLVLIGHLVSFNSGLSILLVVVNNNRCHYP